MARMAAPEQLDVSRWRHLRHRYRETAGPLVRELRPIAVLSLAVLALVLGTIGYMRLHGAHYDVLDGGYRSITLFGVLGGTVEPPVPWQLQVARILAALLTVYAAVRAALALWREHAELLRIRLFSRDHVVIAGLGRSGQRLAFAFHDAHLRVVVIEKDADNPLIPSCRDRGISVVRGDATDAAILRHARTGHARYLVVVCGEDSVNVDVATAARAIVPPGRGGALTALVHVDDLGLWQALQAEAVALSVDIPFRLELFNVYETAARQLLDRHAGVVLPHGGGRRPHALIIGLDGIGEPLVLALARVWQAWGEELRITLAGPAADAELAALLARHPGLADVAELDARPAALGSAALRTAEVMLGPDGTTDVDAAYVCLARESDAMAVALHLHGPAETRHVPVVVAVEDQSAGVATALTSEGGAFAGIEAFGVLTSALSPELLVRGTNEVLARAKHDEWVRHARAAGRADDPSLRPWEELPESLKESNRRFADGIGAKLEAAGLVLVPAPVGRKDAEPFTFLPGEVEQLARGEHERWAADLERDGWRHTDGPKDPERRLHPMLVPWEQLPEEERDKDRDPIRELPDMLARAGFRLYRARTAPATVQAGVLEPS